MGQRNRWLIWLKPLLLLAIVFGVGYYFYRILTSEALQQTDPSRSPGQILWDMVVSARRPDLVASALLYLLGLACPALYWQLLLRRAGEPLPWLTGFRAYYLSHLGKYMPFGRGFALLVRVALASSAGVRAGTAAVTGAYETLTMMAAGALLSVVVLVWLLEDSEGTFWRALGLLALVGLPLMPGVFNRLVKPLAGRFLGGASWPRPSAGALLLGLGMMALCWTLFGASLAAVLQALQPDRLIYSPAEVLRCTAFVAVSYVAGFLSATPGGLGVREWFLERMLNPQLGPRAVVVVLLLRVLWTIAELSIAGLLYFLQGSGVRSQESELTPDPRPLTPGP
jgi:uncharacterized membrane protein YbhN (UPF0104 family)